MGRKGWRARYLKEVDAQEVTQRFWQEIYDDRGKLIEIFEGKIKSKLDEIWGEA